MFSNTLAQSYTTADATGEILIMLVGSFLLGVLLAWLLWGYEEKESGSGQMVINLPPPTPRTAIAPPTPEPPIHRDDLKVIEGIGPKIEQLLYEFEIYSWRDLANTPINRLKNILWSDENVRTIDPGQWPRQAALAMDGRWEELAQVQSKIRSGK